ncbi:MAG: hypothetical protein GXO30_00870 [Epsilonproteobacteria bacterium]|nr:hypothetical protein [Campylobacterota bacterium]
MYIKRYTVGATMLIALVGWYIYVYISQASTSFEFFGVMLPNWPIALWVVIPLIILYLASVFHMAFYSVLSSIRLRKYDKDYERVIDAIADAYLAKAERNNVYKTPRYKLLGSIIDSTTLFPTKALRANTQNEKLDAVINLIDDIRQGEVVDLRKYNLKNTNSLVIQNDKNRYKKGELSAENILKYNSRYDESLVTEAFNDFVKTATVSAIKENKSFLTKDSLFVILGRINAEENGLKLTNEELLELLEVLNLNTKELIEVSVALSSTMLPDQRMKLFETLSEKREDAMEAYLFTLFDLEMITLADEILANSQKGEYENFKAYSTLKECGKNFNINLFI